MQVNAPVLSNSDLPCGMMRKAGTAQVPIQRYLRQKMPVDLNMLVFTLCYCTLQYSHVYEVPKEESHTYVKDFTRLDD